MTISTEPAPLSYDGDDTTDEFPITWKYFAKSHVVATLRDAAGDETVWVLNTDYTLTAAGVDAGGTLTATTPPATGETLVLTLEPPNTQAVSLPLGGHFPSTSVEDGLDLSAQRDSKIDNVLDRTFRVPKTDTQSADDLILPIDSERASKFMAFDANGGPIASSGPTGSSTIPVSAFIETLLDDVNAAAARSTIVAIGEFSTLLSETSPAIDDELIVRDTSASTTDKITLANVLKVLNALTEDTTPDGAADYVLTYDASASAVKKALLHQATKFQVGTFTREMTDASGNQVLTGVGFAPKALIMLAIVTSTSQLSIGFVVSGANVCLINFDSSVPGAWSFSSTQSVYMDGGAGVSYIGVVNALGTDGFTVTWTRSGAPSGTIQVLYLAVR